MMSIRQRPDRPLAETLNPRPRAAFFSVRAYRPALSVCDMIPAGAPMTKRTEHPRDPAYGWVVVAAGAIMTCVGFGAMMSLGVFLQPIAEATGWSRGGISAAATLNFLVMGVSAFLWGALSDRLGTRIVVLLGSLFLGLGLVAASHAATLWQFQLLFGGFVGIAAGSFYAPMVAVASAWIEQHRSLAVALVSAGMGVAPVTI